MKEIVFFGVKGRRYILWWCGNDDKTGGVGILVEELCENVVKVKKRCDKIVAIRLVAITLEEDGESNMCVRTKKWKTRC